MCGTAFFSLRMGGTRAWLLMQPIEQFSVWFQQKRSCFLSSPESYRWVRFTQVSADSFKRLLFINGENTLTSQSPLSLSQIPFRVLLPSSVCHESWTASQDDIRSLRTRTGTFVAVSWQHMPAPHALLNRPRNKETKDSIIPRQHRAVRVTAWGEYKLGGYFHFCQFGYGAWGELLFAPSSLIHLTWNERLSGLLFQLWNSVILR